MVPLRPIEYGLGYLSQNKVQPDHFNHNNLNSNSNPKTDPNRKSENNVCSTKWAQVKCELRNCEWVLCELKCEPDVRVSG